MYEQRKTAPVTSGAFQPVSLSVCRLWYGFKRGSSHGFKRGGENTRVNTSNFSLIIFVILFLWLFLARQRCSRPIHKSLCAIEEELSNNPWPNQAHRHATTSFGPRMLMTKPSSSQVGSLKYFFQFREVREINHMHAFHDLTGRRW